MLFFLYKFLFFMQKYSNLMIFSFKNLLTWRTSDILQIAYLSYFKKITKLFLLFLYNFL